MRIKDLQPIVRVALQECPEARDNHLVLYRMVFGMKGWNMNLNKMSFDGDIFGSISRAARKCVASDPSLAPTKRVMAMRKEKEEEIKEWNRNSL